MGLKNLTNNHPFMKKMVDLYEYMEKNNISLYVNFSGELQVVDTEINKSYLVKDIDSDSGTVKFPSDVKFKLIFND
jgi:hypothetical protein